MAINLRHILARIEEMGVETAVKKLESYEESGPSAEEFFGKDCVQNLRQLIHAEDVSEVSDNRYTSEEVKYNFNIEIKTDLSFYSTDGSIQKEEYSYAEYYNPSVDIEVVKTSVFCNDNISELDYSKAA